MLHATLPTVTPLSWDGCQSTHHILVFISICHSNFCNGGALYLVSVHEVQEQLATNWSSEKCGTKPIMSLTLNEFAQSGIAWLNIFCQVEKNCSLLSASVKTTICRSFTRMFQVLWWHIVAQNFNSLVREALNVLIRMPTQVQSTQNQKKISRIKEETFF